MTTKLLTLNPILVPGGAAIYVTQVQNMSIGVCFQHVQLTLLSYLMAEHTLPSPRSLQPPDF